ncbi:MAG: hypothetical protein ACI8TQ_002209 [Planctomycetota bacterium]|jgi:hypothetical protein
MSQQVRTLSRHSHRPQTRSNLARISGSFPLGTKIFLRAQLALILLVAGLGMSCIAAPLPSDWLDAGNAPFRTPEGTFNAFKTAAAGNAADLGYRCLSSEFRRRNGMGQLAFRELRDRFPWFKYLSRAKVLEETQIGEDQIEYLCEIEVLFKTIQVRFGFLREDYFDVFSGAETIGGEVQPFDKLTKRVEARGVPWVEIHIPVPGGRKFDDITEIRVGREWKIDAIEMIESENPPTP